jgi:hypothetical protein
MEQITLKNIEQSLGTPLAVVLITAAVFMLPKIIYEAGSFYKEVGHNISKTLEKHK